MRTQWAQSGALNCMNQAHVIAKRARGYDYAYGYIYAYNAESSPGK
jgi:hypothetical protein